MDSSVDALTQVLHDLRLSDSHYCRSELSNPWGLDIPAICGAIFHFVATGECWVRHKHATAQLKAGDLVLFPHGNGHYVGTSAEGSGMPIFDLPVERLGRASSVLRHGGGGQPTLLICGSVHFDTINRPLVELLPEMMLVSAYTGVHEAWLGSTLEAMMAEAQTPRPGSETVITRLADILIIGAVRSWLESSPESRTGWLGALRDARIGRALAIIHRQAERSWTVASLAAEVHMSRAVFAERFTELVGAPPMQYLTRWRMQLASVWIRDERLSLSEVAERLGYGSDASFSRAFKRHMGQPPGALKRALDPEVEVNSSILQ